MARISYFHDYFANHRRSIIVARGENGGHGDVPTSRINLNRACPREERTSRETRLTRERLLDNGARNPSFFLTREELFAKRLQFGDAVNGANL